MVDYEAENALEWAEPSRVAEILEQKKRSQQAQARTQEDSQQRPWSLVVNTRPAWQQVRSAPARAQVVSPSSQQPRQPPPGFSHAAAAGASQGRAEPQDRSLTSRSQQVPEIHTQKQGITPENGRVPNTQYHSQPISSESALQERQAFPRPESPFSGQAERAMAVRPTQQHTQARQGFRHGPPKPTQKPTTKFAKVRPENDNYGKDAAARRKAERKKLALIEQQAAVQEDVGHRGVFILGDQVAAKPAAILRNLQELARHRKSNLGHSRTDSTIQIIAPELQTIQLILSRTRGMVLNAASAEDQIHMVLVDSPADGMMLEGTAIRRVSAWNKDARPKAAGMDLPKGNDKMFPVLDPVSRDLVDFEGERRRVLRNALALQVAATKALDKLVYYKGAITMRVNFGALAFLKYQWSAGEKSQPTDKFVNNLSHSSTAARLYKLAEDGNLFNHLTHAKHLIAPYTRGKILDTMPSFVGMFIWATGADARIYEVRTETCDNATGAAPSVNHRGWLSPNAPGLASPLSVYLTQLNCGISAAFQVHTEPHFVQPKDLPEGLTAQTTKPLKSEDYQLSASRGELMFDWRETSCTDFRQRTVYKFRVKANTSFILQLTRHDSYRRIFEGPVDRRPVETRWDASVYHQEWEEKFSTNISLKPGERASWAPTLEEFFPSDDPDADDIDGVSPGFLAIVQWVREFLNTVNRQERRDVWCD